MRGGSDPTVTVRSREFSLLVWTVPLTIVIHNGEEALTMPRWAAENLLTVAQQFSVHISRVPTADELYVALAMGALVPLLVALVAFLSGPRTLALYLLAGIQGIMLANAFVPHLVGTIILRRYTPGVVTAVLVIIPFSIFWFHRIRRRGFAERRPLIISFVVGALVYPLGLAVLYKASGLL
jgi:hypothetical protein